MKPIAITAALIVTFSLFCLSVTMAGTVTDIDGNVYQTVTIGSQEWMAENLKVTHYRDGRSIRCKDGSWQYFDWFGAYGHYADDSSFAPTYGRLYDWPATGQGLAPAGWHVPTADEWKELIDYLGGSSVAGGKMKEIGTVHWVEPNTGATNVCGFTGLPGGYRTSQVSVLMGFSGSFWSSTQDSLYSIWYFSLSYNDSIGLLRRQSAQTGSSVRCIKDKDTCCVGSTGNVDCDPGDGTDISDLTALIDYLYITFSPLCCPFEANADGQPGIDISDLTALIDYLYISFTPPAACQ